jgi:hypothetical protein
MNPMPIDPKLAKSGTVNGRPVSIFTLLVVAGIITIGGYQLLKLGQEKQFLAHKAEELKIENERLSNDVAQALRQTRANSPTVLSSNSKSVPSGTTALKNPAVTNLIARIIEGNPPQLTTEQAEAYLNKSHRNALSLIAAFRSTGNDQFLDEAVQRFPNDPHVNFAAAVKKDSPSEERRLRLDAFKEAAPDNALANYLSAVDYFKSGQSTQAISELNAASAKPQFQDYSMEFMQNAEEAYRAAGYSEAEAKMIAMTSLLLPHLPQIRDLGKSMAELSTSYRQAGDQASADILLQMTCGLGQRLDQATREPLLTQLVGMAIERGALSTMDPASPYGGGTVKDRLDELAQLRAGMKELTQQFDTLQPMMSADDWSNYVERQRLFGEKSALQWMVGKYGQK